MLSRHVLLFSLCCAVLVCQAQISPLELKECLDSETKQARLALANLKQTKRFYEIYRYRPVWIDSKVLLSQLSSYIKSSPDLGLDENAYQYELVIAALEETGTHKTKRDSLLTEIRITDAALHFFRDVTFGDQAPVLGYNGLNYSPQCYDIPALMAESLSGGRFQLLLQQVEPTSKDYTAIKNKIIQYNSLLRDTLVKTNPKITSTICTDQNKPLMQKLYQLKLIDTSVRHISPAALKLKVKELQDLYSLLNDGVLRTTLINELNVPLSRRIQELNRALNTIRCLRCIRTQYPRVIAVNIPSATLLLYNADTVLMESRTVVGKYSTRTPTLGSIVTEVVLYPYWMVPGKIATKELLPLIKRSSAFLDANNFQVLNLQGKVVNPATIDWTGLNAGNFPYILRQSTGCDNALGILKLNFYSPFGVYLHDTPWKSMFGFNKRYFSHGCIRVEKAIELARFVLNDNTVAIDTITEKGCLQNQKPISVPALQKVPLFVLYNTAWADSSGTVRFYEDVYERSVVYRK